MIDIRVKNMPFLGPMAPLYQILKKVVYVDGLRLMHLIQFVLQIDYVFVGCGIRGEAFKLGI